jgi:hypothetical protein
VSIRRLTFGCCYLPLRYSPRGAGTATWDPVEERKATRVYLSSSVTDIHDRGRWPEVAEWLVDTQTRLRVAFAAVGGLGGCRGG